MSTCIKNMSLAFFLDRNKDIVTISLLFYFFLNHDSFPVVHPTTILRPIHVLRMMTVTENDGGANMKGPEQDGRQSVTDSFMRSPFTTPLFRLHSLCM